LCPRADLRVPDHGDPHLLPCCGYLPWRSRGLNTDTDLFGDCLQLVLGFIAFRLEPSGGTIIVVRAGGVGTARRSRGIARHGRSCGWCGGMIPLDEPGNTRRIVRNREGSKRAKKKSTSTTSDERQRGSLRPRHWPGACCCCLPWSF
jgi:hypothetical protein